VGVGRIDRIIAAEGMKMKSASDNTLKDGDSCTVVGGSHKGKSGTVKDSHTSKTGHVTITVVQKNGERFKTLARNVVVLTGGKSM
jgi:ribosomal protein S4E